MVLKSIGVLSCGKTLGIVYAALGLIVGGFMSIAALTGMAIPQAQGGPQPGPIPAAMFGAGAIVLFPIMYAVMGFFGGIIAASVYNVAAGVVGGIEVEFEHAQLDYAAE